MKVLLSWLREFVDVPASAEEIAATMSVRGFAVESIERIEPDDTLIDFEVTANRPDCMSVAGMAREVATAYGVEMRSTRRDVSAAVPLRAVTSGSDIAVVIEDAALCPR